MLESQCIWTIFKFGTHFAYFPLVEDLPSYRFLGYCALAAQ